MVITMGDAKDEDKDIQNNPGCVRITGHVVPQFASPSQFNHHGDCSLKCKASHVRPKTTIAPGFRVLFEQQKEGEALVSPLSKTLAPCHYFLFFWTKELDRQEDLASDGPLLFFFAWLITD